VQKLSEYDENMSVLCPFTIPGISSETDNAMKSLILNNQRLQAIVQYLENIIRSRGGRIYTNSNTSVVAIEFGKQGKNAERTLIHTTTKRAKLLHDSMTDEMKSYCGELRIEEYKGDHKRVTSDVIEQCISDIENSKYSYQALRSVFSCVIQECVSRRSCLPRLNDSSSIRLCCI
jgi:hypothetical protein